MKVINQLKQITYKITDSYFKQNRCEFVYNSFENNSIVMETELKDTKMKPKLAYTTGFDISSGGNKMFCGS